MIHIEALTTAVELAGARPKETRPATRNTRSDSSRPTDAVNVSEAAYKASALSNDESSDVRQERIEAARQHIEEGAHRMEGLIRLIAARISPFVGA